MALQDILNSIIGDADKRIAEATTTHRERMKLMREESDRAITRKRSQIDEQREQKKRQLKEKAESIARMSRNKALMSKKQEYMTEVYDQVLEKLTNLPKDKAEAFLKTCLKHVHGKGVIHPAKSHEVMLRKLLPDNCEMGDAIDSVGGFRFSSKKEEHDFTFEFLVNDLLRPSTEVKVAHTLFSVSKAD